VERRARPGRGVPARRRRSQILVSGETSGWVPADGLRARGSKSDAGSPPADGIPVSYQATVVGPRGPRYTLWPPGCFVALRAVLH
jgi:hypothetical protein